MTPIFFSIVFLAALLVSVVVRLWLAQRQMRHVFLHRNTVPERFSGVIGLTAHQKAADYTVANVRLGTVENIFNAALLVVLTVLGGIQLMDNLVRSTVTQWLGGNDLLHQILLVVFVTLVTSLIDLPFELYRQFRLEARFGFNKMTLGLWAMDTLKGTGLALVLGMPLLAVILWLMAAAGPLWWFYTWLVWIGYFLLLQVLAPVVIAPLFNKFEPLRDNDLATRIQTLLTRCGFTSRGVFVMDGSRRSAHGNAYFTGFGAAKRIVFYDTLVARLTPPEIEAVLAHELGHFKHRHVFKRMVWLFIVSLAGLALLGWLVNQPWFYTGLGVEPSLTGRNDGLALLLFMLVLPTFLFLTSPLSSLSSRKHEFQADEFAASQTSAADLVRALVKLYEDNASTLTPDPLHSVFFDSHPPAALRVQQLDKLIVDRTSAGFAGAVPGPA